MPGMGMPMPVAAPPKVVKYELCKPKLNPPKEGKTKAFGWKRVVIDRNGLGDKPATNEVVDNGLRKLDSNYKGLKTIWINIESAGSRRTRMLNLRISRPCSRTR